jgi:hypothetical protein
MKFKKKLFLALLLVQMILPVIGQEADNIENLFNAAVEDVRKQKELTDELYEYKLFNIKHNEAVLKWDLFITKFFFFFTVGITSYGIWFAIKNINAKANVEITPDGIKIKGTIGLILLFLSLAFFYLYMKIVYPIQVLSAIPG